MVQQDVVAQMSDARLNRGPGKLRHECTEQTELSNCQLEGVQRSAEDTWHAAHLVGPDRLGF